MRPGHKSTAAGGRPPRRRGLPSGCSTPRWRQPDGSGWVEPCHAGGTGRSVATADAGAPGSRPAAGVLGSPLPQGVGDHDRETAADGATLVGRARPTDAGNAAASDVAAGAGSVPVATHL